MQTRSDPRACPRAQLHDPDVLRSRDRGTPRPLASRTSWGLAALALLSACASAPPVPARTQAVRQLSPSEEAEAIAAAKRHPVALTYERPGNRAANLPVPPPPIPPEPAPSAPPPPPDAQQPPVEISRDRDGDSRAVQGPVQNPPHDEVIIVGQDPPANSTVTTYVWPEPDPTDYGTGGGSVWVDGAWVGSGPGVRAYVEPRPWGWGWRRRYYGRPPPGVFYPPAVVVVPHRPHWHHHHRHATPPRTRYAAPPSRRREVYVAPPARDRGQPRVRSAPPARGSSRGEVRSAPAAQGRRTVRMR